jgi:hypothetical protein
MEPEISLPLLQEPDTHPYPELILRDIIKVDLKETGCKSLNGFIWLGLGTGRRVFGTLY